ncbi:MAG: DUF86 domain-containing protein [Steroidobacteraceae bacterium]|nr:DUF86 domain-containing protein [Nevskiaceae bacterium]MCP5339452.1 DUF86 domain-containing protein [Nevskiaceae bacterium]MCP5360565.1 DUF86 domain-containing protein [Nevskiaceae bacterium]MCP5472912.1 DUF86 domain-containing protein [Nevskiaceae bacterium]
MDGLIVAEKIEALRRCVRRIEDRRATTAAELRQDVDRQDILSLNLTRAVQLCVDIAAHVLSGTERQAPQTMGEAFALLAEDGRISAELARRLRAAVGFRNIAVHAYSAIDWDIVHAISYAGMDDFRQFASAMATAVEEGARR